MKRIALVAALLGVLVFSGIALAGGGYGSQPGYGVAIDNTVCAGAGAFGAFGENSGGWHDLGINNDKNANGAVPGTPGYQVGLNNSGLCGNR